LHGLLESAAERADTVSEMAERLLAQASKIPIPGRVRSPVLLQQLELPGIHLSDFDCAIVGNALRRLGPGLTVLDLRDCGMGIDGVMAFSAGMSRARLTALHVLLLGGNWTEAQLEMAVACTRAVCEGLVLSGASNLETLSLPTGGSICSPATSAPRVARPSEACWLSPAAAIRPSLLRHRRCRASAWRIMPCRIAVSWRLRALSDPTPPSPPR
jgi:hypothetical protein